jgi:endoglucanase
MGSLADQWDYLAGQNQQFKVQAAANGSYLLTPVHVSGKCLEVWGWSGANGGAVDMWDYTGTGGANQNWLIQPTYDGFYKIINVNSGKALEVTLGTGPAVPFRNGSAVDQLDYFGGKNQQWGFVKI